MVALAWATPAAAHLGLRTPPSREGDNVLKIGPCGRAGSVRGDRVTVLDSGASIEVVWDEYIDHPGHFRIAFDDDGDDDFVDPLCLSGCGTRSPEIESYSNATVLLDHIADTPAGGESGATVRLPDVECERCTLQVIQVMYDKPPFTSGGDDVYYQCADLTLRRSAAATPTPTPTATPTASPAPTVTPARLPCAGDCGEQGGTTLDDLRAAVAIALLRPSSATCLASLNADGALTVDELIGAVNERLHGCTPAPPP